MCKRKLLSCCIVRRPNGNIEVELPHLLYSFLTVDRDMSNDSKFYESSGH